MAEKGSKVALKTGLGKKGEVGVIRVSRLNKDNICEIFAPGFLRLIGE